MKHLSLLTAFLFPLSSFSQSTFEQVHAILQANCTTSACHDNTSPSGNLNLSGTTTDVYSRLINTNPVNPAAVSKGFKTVAPGYPERSFLFIKLSHDIDPVAHLTQPMGNPMPDGQPRLDYEEIELVRQWILYGAGDTNHYVSSQLLSDYYNGPGIPRINALTPPDPSEGFQLHYGPFFLAAGTEKEFFYKYETMIPDSTEVHRVKTEINEYSHHTALYKYNDDLDIFFDPGLRPVNSIIDAAGVYYASDIIGQWPNSQDLILPQGTAFYWEDSAVVDINYHIPNYNQDSILPAELYMNIYTQPTGTAQTEMISGPIYYGGDNPLNLTLFPNGNDTTLVINHFETDTTYTWYIWSMMAHTHRLGKEYNVWLRNNDGTKGEHIYDGHYNSDYTFNQGYYDWAHPPFRTFEPLKEVNFTNGLIHEATFNNPGPDTVGFGLRTTDEMYVTYIQYTTQPVTIGIEEEGGIFNYFNVYPNPSNDVVNLSWNSDESSSGTLSLHDITGRQVYAENISIKTGNQKVVLSKERLMLGSGIYVLSISTENGTRTTKIIFN